VRSHLKQVRKQVETPSPTVDAPDVKVVAIESMNFDSANVRKRDQRATKTLEASLRQFGPARSIVLDANGVVRAGNGTLEAAAAAGATEVLVVKRKRNQLVAVQCDDWTAVEATAYAIADNRTAELATWDYQALGLTLNALQADDFDLDVTGWEPHEVEPLLLADWSPAAVDDLPGLGDERKDGEHKVKFSADQWETIEIAIAAKRDKQPPDEKRLTEEQCLELICASYLHQ
jgi:ParB-like chromosome segregation protein Spo0J